jgi:hypothetical protein
MDLVLYLGWHGHLLCLRAVFETNHKNGHTENQPRAPFAKLLCVYPCRPTRDLCTLQMNVTTGSRSKLARRELLTSDGKEILHIRWTCLWTWVKRGSKEFLEVRGLLGGEAQSTTERSSSDLGVQRTNGRWLLWATLK